MSLRHWTQIASEVDVTDARNKPRLTARDAPARRPCGSPMKAIAFIEPHQGDVIEKIPRHCGL